MDLQPFKNRNGSIIVFCTIAIILIYSVDIMKLTYRLTGWQPFGDTPVAVNQIEYFIPDTPNVIGYGEPGGSTVSCATTVAYIKTDTEETYRCCDTGDKISCLGGNYSSDIPTVDQECTNKLQEALAISATLEGARDYHFYGNCRNGEGSELTLVQIDANGQILWKYINTGNIMILSSALRCIVAPLLFVLIVVIIAVTIRRKPNEPMRKLW